MKVCKLETWLLVNKNTTAYNRQVWQIEHSYFEQTQTTHILKCWSLEEQTNIIVCFWVFEKLRADHLKIWKTNQMVESLTVYHFEYFTKMEFGKTIILWNHYYLKLCTILKSWRNQYNKKQQQHEHVNKQKQTRKSKT